jgi:peptide/nickel transport system substrate-binding protein
LATGRAVLYATAAVLAAIAILAMLYLYTNFSSTEIHTTTAGILNTVATPSKTSTTTSTATSQRANQTSCRTLRIALGDWGPPSPFLFYPRGPGYVLTSLVFDTLVWKDKNGVIPWLAESWEHPDPYTWVFHLRHDVYWQDGRPFTARDVVFTIKYLANNHWAWKNIDPKLIQSIEAPDNYTVVIRLSKPYALFLEDYASTIFILPEHIWSHIDSPHDFRSPEAFIGTGPYRLVSYEPGKGYVFTANKGFWGGHPVYDRIVVASTGFTNPQAEATALLQGRIDTATFMGKAYRVVKMLRQRMPSLRIKSGPMYWVLFLGFNLDKWPYNETPFRRAIAYAINTTELVLKAVGSLEAAVPGEPGYIPPYSPFYNPDAPRYPYSPSKARQLLDGLGLRDRDGDGCRDLPDRRPWRPVLVTTSQYTQEALVIKQMLRKVGVCVEVKTLKSYAQLDSIVKRGMYDLEINGHGATGNTPTAFAWYFSGRFGARWVNKTYQVLAEKILEAKTRDEAYRYARKIQVVIASQLPQIALYYPNVFVVTRPGVCVDWFFTKGGIDGGIPLPYNKLALIEGAKK